MGNKPEFTELVERHGKEIFVFLYRLMQQSTEAEDCLQETYLRAYRAYDGLGGSANPRAWLYRIASNVAMTRLKQRGRQAEQLHRAIASPAVSVEQQIEQRLELDQLRSAVTTLPDKQRAALVMRKYQELSYTEIGLALEITPEAARANVYQGLKKLRARFSEQRGSPDGRAKVDAPAAVASDRSGSRAGELR